jgi:hypothetical protein
MDRWSRYLGRYNCTVVHSPVDHCYTVLVMSPLFHLTCLLCPVVLRVNMLDDLKKSGVTRCIFVSLAEQRFPP